jgi:hypothetical protein
MRAARSPADALAGESIRRRWCDRSGRHGPRAAVRSRYLQGDPTMTSPVIDAWHALVKSRDPVALDALLADDAVFHSPVVHTPQRGRAIVGLYLLAAFQVLGNATFHYVREVVGDRDAVLEFSGEVDGITINGVDMIRWNDAGRIVDFKVMVRPLKAVNLLHQKMGEMLRKLG